MFGILQQPFITLRYGNYRYVRHAALQNCKQTDRTGILFPKLFWPTKGQLISKAIYGVEDSPKKWP